MVLDCCWVPDGSGFVTASRDKTVKLWASTEDGSWAVATSIKLAESVTAIDMVAHEDNLILAVGTEAGALSVYSVHKGSLEATLLHAVDDA